MANITSSRRGRKGPRTKSFKPDPKRLRPLRYKTALGLAFEGLMERLGINSPPAPTKVIAAWEGTR
ncbi:hypothetical protein SAMN06295937_100753 [Sphingopyxis flava]|uniref:Uncharacterized protein n=1 Tax=Sphingopyxis flava TaxID=1507287 RepID=A0A1T5BR39_9SPHN|nr:hypothetical protein SAMN06295937_100753 [Sphingopyxis flava]